MDIYLIVDIDLQFIKTDPLCRDVILFMRVLKNNKNL